MTVAEEVVGLLDVVLASSRWRSLEIDGLRAIFLVLEPGDASVLRPQQFLQDALIGVSPGDIDGRARKRQVFYIIDSQSETMKPLRLGLEIKRRQ